MRLGETLLLTFFALTATLLTAQDRPVQVSISPVKDPLVLHEPVIIRVVVENLLDQAVKMDSGQWLQGDLDATLTRPDGQAVKGRDPSGIIPGGQVTLAPHSSHETLLIADRWFDFDEMGTYVLDVTLPWPLPARGAPLSHSIKARTTVNIGLRDHEQLKRICSDLAERAMKEGPRDDDGYFAADALSFIKDPVAVPFIARLVEPDGTLERRALRGLAAIADRASVEILIPQLRGHPQNVQVWLQDTLSTIERTTKDIAIRQRIEDALK